MSDLIDRQSAIDAFQMFRKYDSSRSNSEWVDRIEVVLKNQPTIDAVEVVRCKDCKYMGEVSLTHNGDYIVNSCGYHNSFVNKNDYCSRAERRTDETY